jgi:hypothetical protein
MKTTTALFLAAGLALSLASCKSDEEQAREAALENKADALESQAKATEKAGEAQSDALKNEAERTREQK